MGTQLVRFERCPLVLERSGVVCMIVVCSSWRFLARVSFFFCLLSFFLARFVGIRQWYLQAPGRGQTESQLSRIKNTWWAMCERGYS